MARRPNASAMDDMAIPKAKARDAVPFAPSTEPAAPSAKPEAAAPYKATSLTIRLGPEDYAALRGYCGQEEQKLGRRVSHQEVMVRGLRALIKARR